MRQGPTEAAVTSVVDMASHLATSDPSERERWVKNIRYAITQLAARQFAYGQHDKNLKEIIMKSPAGNEYLSQDEQDLITQIVERAVKYDVVFYRNTFLLEQQLLEAHAREPIAWGRLRFAHIDDFAADIKAIMARPAEPIKNTQSFYSALFNEPVEHVAPEPVAPTVQRCPFTGAPLTPAAATPKPFVF